jgi:DNA-binding NarL/FixJ family response regulator
VRVVIAEDQLLLRDGLSRLLRDNDVEVVAAVGDAEALLAGVAEQRPELAIVDIRMPPTFRDEGVRAALEIRSTFPDTAVLILSQYVEQTYAAEILADGRGRVGYLLKDRVFDVADFIEAVHRVSEGGTALDPQVVAQLVSQQRRGSPLDRLSDREREVLGVMAEGRSNAAIAEVLVLTIGAVEKHIANIFTKLDLPPSDTDNRRVLAVLAHLQQQAPPS